ncbi:EAL domain-containing protein [Halarcobacter sp.]|uniref:EAL domain-containing protein n=1 Tax=Halarcobacter sp. TaxID=2321133 RepID=UPI003A8F9A4B
MDISFYKNLINTISDCLVIYKVHNDSKKFEIVEVNTSSLELEKLSREDLVGKDVLDVFPGIKEMGLLDVFNKVYKTGKTISHPLKFYEDDRISGYRENIIYKLDSHHIMAVYSDITKEKHAQQELHKTLAFLKSHQNALNASNIVTKSDINGFITYANENFYQITGFTQDEVIGKPHNILRHPDNPKSLYKEMWKTIQSKNIFKRILKNRGKLGDYWIDLSILPILDDKGEIYEYIAVRHDITETIEQKNKLDNIANTNSLTRLGSRYKLLNDLDEAINPAMAVINIDDFSQINELYGHEAGDNVLIQFSNNLKTILTYNGFESYHIHSDEFVIYNKNISKDEFIENLLEIKNKLKKVNVIVNSKEILLNFTTAVSTEEKSSILQTVDMALKVAKRENKSFIIYRDEISLNDEYKNNIKWTKSIKKAIDTNNIVPVFQPIVNNKTLEYEKYESLVRLKENDRLITPFFFLDIAKKTKQYFDITKIMTEKTFEFFCETKKEFSINLTVEDILNDDIKTHLFYLLNKYDIGKCVVFEIVESESIENFDKVIEFIENVKSFNCKVAIDDFGTGYSNFAYLMKLKTDYIKIDGSLIKNLHKNKESQIIVSTIVDFSKKMNIKTIAEYVENELIFNKVKELGIDYSQGYYFSEPKTEI